MRTVEVRAAAPYPVHVGSGASQLLGEQVRDANRVALLHAPVLGEQARRLAADLPQPLLVELPDAEAAKTSETLIACWDRLADAGFTRNDLVVGFGGGATTDLAGFVAASWLRGIGFVSMPSTVLGMVDAAVGGKTGINIPAGKNLVGAFHEPRAVLCDLDLLATLPEADARAGMAEVVKCGFIRDQRILDLLTEDVPDAMDVGSERFGELVLRAIQVKADTVSGDLREATSASGRVGREALNYGHTLGHAIERQDGFGWRHGEAISIGMVFAAMLSQQLLGLPEDQVDFQRDLLDRMGLPTTHDSDWQGLRAAMNLDKKTRGNTLRFVGLREVGEVAMIEGPAEDLLAACYSRLRPRASAS